MFEILNQPASVVAPRLLGCVLERNINGQVAKVRIVETEAYDQTDIASHSYKPKSLRTEVMFGQAGHLYVYFTYGMHFCCNVVVGPKGYGAAVLIRAVEPISSERILQQNRPGQNNSNLTNGPAKLCQALQIDKSLNGHNLKNQPLKLTIKPELPAENIVQTTRIGISKGKEVPWRFYIRGNNFVSAS